MDNLIYKTFVRKFNEQYNGKLLEGQERLLGKYIASFHDDGVDLKVFLNEELTRLREHLTDSLKDENVADDTTLFENAKKVLSLIDSYREVPIDISMIQQVLKIQGLVKELSS